MSASQCHAQVFPPAKYVGFPSQKQSPALPWIYRTKYPSQDWIQTNRLVGERISELLQQSLVTCSSLKCVERGEEPPSTVLSPLQVKLSLCIQADGILFPFPCTSSIYHSTAAAGPSPGLGLPCAVGLAGFGPG